MQQQLQKHTVFHSVGVSINKTPTFQILLFSILYFLFSIPLNSQTYNWQWAMNGGGSDGGTGGGTYDEQIYDVKVGTDGNYYFIGTMVGLNGAQLDGELVDVYNSSLGGNDIFIFSTTCEGQVRWSQAIGGEGLLDRAYSIALDSNNNVYVGAHVQGGSNYSVHFSPNAIHDITPFPANPEAYKRTYLVKYDSNGNFINKKALQGTVDNTNNQSQILDLYIDSTNTIHFIVGFLKGTHLGGQVTVPPTVNVYQYFLAKYDSSLNYVSSMLLPIADGSGFNDGQVKFVYDETLNRYYIAGERSIGTPLIYNGDAIVNKAFILAINGNNANEVWRRELYSEPTGQLANNRFTSLKIDSNSDVYIGGNLFIHPNDQNVKFYDPTDTSVQPYLFTPGADWTLPLIVKFNSSGAVQWAQATAAYSSGVLGPAPRYGKGLAINGSEVTFGVQSGADFWDAIEIVRPIINYQPDPVLVRFNKQTGAVINVHDIQGEAVSTKQMTAVATDKDGNYITAGTFNANLFMNNTLGITPLVSTGQADFFVAKLGATPCGTPVSTEIFNKLNVNVYPNPTNDIINIDTDEKLTTYKIFNESAQQIMGRGQIYEGKYQINLEGLSSGVYFILIKTESLKSTTIKVVKK